MLLGELVSMQQAAPNLEKANPSLVGRWQGCCGQAAKWGPPFRNRAPQFDGCYLKTQKKAVQAEGLMRFLLRRADRL